MQEIVDDRIQVFMRFALDLAKLSKCTERKVAAIITDGKLNQVLSIGVNGGPIGLEDCMCVTEGKYGCIHAEINALVKLQADAYSKRMFITLTPCKQCAAAIINCPGGFSHVYYLEQWKDTTGISMLQRAGIKTIEVSREVLR